MRKRDFLGDSTGIDKDLSLRGATFLSDRVIWIRRVELSQKELVEGAT